MVLLRRQSSENQHQTLQRQQQQKQQQQSSAYNYGYGYGGNYNGNGSTSAYSSNNNNNYDPEYNTDIRMNIPKPTLGRRANSLPSPTSSSGSSFFSSTSSSSSPSSSSSSFSTTPNSYPTSAQSSTSLSSSSPPSSSSSSSSIIWRLFNSAQGFILIYTIYTVFMTHYQLNSKLSQLEQLNEEYNLVHEDYTVAAEDLANVEMDFREMRLQLHAIVPRVKDQLKDHVSHSNVVAEVLVERHDAMEDRIKVLEEAIRDIDRKELERRYGQGPYTIEIQVQVEGNRKFFEIQTAPNDLVPHSIRTFMDLVENRVWDRTVLYHQVKHVVVGVPVGLDGIRKNPDTAKGLLFADYSEKFPHKRNTIGFQGSPGGPEFYINLDDNVKIHGPGGQQYEDMFEEADSCFGLVQNGDEVLELFSELNAKALDSKNGVYYSMIESMRFVRSG